MHLGALDGLRGIVVLAVVAYHLERLRGGFVGVDVFFVLSGFLITRLIIAEHRTEGRISLRGFWARRVRRLLPAMTVTAVAVMVAGRRLLPGWRLTDLRVDSIAALGFVSNWRFIGSGHSYFDSASDASPLRHTWSLAVEEQFYLLWPLLLVGAVLLLRGRVRWAAVVVSVLVASGSVVLLYRGAGAGWDPSRLYFGTDTRIFAMAFGGFVATFFDPLRSWVDRGGRDRVAVRSGLVVTGWVGLLLIVVAFLVAEDRAPWMYRWGFVTVAVAMSAVIVGLSPSGSRLEALLSGRAIRWIGDRSYGIYLFSWPIQLFLGRGLPELDRTGRDLLVVVVTVVVAAVSHGFLERPIVEGRAPWHRRGARARPASRTGRVPAVVVAAVVAAGLVVGLSTDAQPKPDFLSLDGEAVVAEALAPGGFSGDRGRPREPVKTAPGRDPVPVSSDLDQGLDADVDELSFGVTVAVDAFDPGPDPPFDPAAPLHVTGTGRDGWTVHGRRLRVMLMGDSVPLSLTPIDEFASEVAVEVDNRSFLGCSLLPYDWVLRAPDGDTERYDDFCRKQEEAQLTGLAAGPDVALLWMGAWETVDHRDPEGVWHRAGDEEHAVRLADALQRRIDHDRAAGVPTVLVRTPCFGADRGGGRRVERSTDALAWWNGLVEEVAARNPGWVRVIDPEPLLCSGGAGDRRLADGRPIRPDGLHFDLAGRRHLWTVWLEDALASAFVDG